MFCQSCGRQVAPGARFCGGCGAPQAEASAPATPASAPPVRRPGGSLLVALVGAALLAVVAGVLVATAPAPEESMEALATGSWTCDPEENQDFTLDLEADGDLRIANDDGVSHGAWRVAHGQLRMEIDEEFADGEGHLPIEDIRVRDRPGRSVGGSGPSIDVGRSLDEVVLHDRGSEITCERDG